MRRNLRMLVVFAHPDDAEHACGGTVALWAHEGDILYVSVTSGEGTSRAPPGMNPRKVARLREHHLLAAATILGVGRVAFMRRPDGRVKGDRRLKRGLERVIRAFRPSLVLTHDPERRDMHPDHVAVGTAVAEAAGVLKAGAAGGGAGGAAGPVEAVWFFRPRAPNCVVDVSPTVGRKLQALAAHRLTVPAGSGAAARVQEASRRVGLRAGFEYGEAFRVVAVGGWVAPGVRSSPV